MSYKDTKAWKYLTFRFGEELDLEQLQMLGNKVCLVLDSSCEKFDDVEDATFWFDDYWETFKPVIDNQIHVFDEDGVEINYTPERESQILTEDSKKLFKLTQ